MVSQVIIGGATSITLTSVTADRALLPNDNGQVVVPSIIVQHMDSQRVFQVLLKLN